VQPAAGLGGSTVTLGATFDGAPVVVPKRVPIAIDVWSAEYATNATGGCAIGASDRGRSQSARYALSLFVVACAFAVRRRIRDASA
jgi:hypothetical protein